MKENPVYDINEVAEVVLVQLPEGLLDNPEQTDPPSSDEKISQFVA